MPQLNYIVTIVGIALVCVFAQELYSDKYDGIDAASILENDKLRDQYYGCFMGTLPCVTADAKFFQEYFEDAYQTDCRRCTEKQKVLMKMIQDWYEKNQPEQWQAFVAKSNEDLKKKGQ